MIQKTSAKIYKCVIIRSILRSILRFIQCDYLKFRKVFTLNFSHRMLLGFCNLFSSYFHDEFLRRNLYSPHHPFLPFHHKNKQTKQQTNNCFPRLLQRRKNYRKNNREEAHTNTHTPALNCRPYFYAQF